jgi:hypothetical protein
VIDEDKTRVNVAEVLGRQADGPGMRTVCSRMLCYMTADKRAVLMLDRQHRSTTCTKKNWSRRRRVPWSAVSPYRMQTTHRLHAPCSHTPCPTSLGNNSLSHIPPFPSHRRRIYMHICVQYYTDAPTGTRPSFHL